MKERFEFFLFSIKDGFFDWLKQVGVTFAVWAVISIISLIFFGSAAQYVIAIAAVIGLIVAGIFTIGYVGSVIFGPFMISDGPSYGSSFDDDDF